MEVKGGAGNCVKLEGRDKAMISVQEAKEEFAASQPEGARGRDYFEPF